MNFNETFGPIRRALAVGGLTVVGTIALTGCGILDAADDTANDTEVSGEQVDAIAEAAPGDCLPEEMLGADRSTFAIDCSDPAAFWTLTAIEADPAVTATADGSSVEDPQPVYDLCGETVAAQTPGATWTDWSMVYDPTTLTVDYLFCVEAIGIPSSLGTNPIVPAAGECFNSTAAEFQYGTLPCDSPDVDTVVVDAIAVDQAEWETADAEAISAQCEGEWAYYFPAVDQFGRTNAVYCTE